MREAFQCRGCGGSLRYRDQATLIIDEFGRGQFLNLDRLVRSGRNRPSSNTRAFHRWAIRTYPVSSPRLCTDIRLARGKGRRSS